jgi:chromosome partition protein MukE
VTGSGFDSLEAVIADERFPDVDLMLRRGRHIGRDDGAAYDYLVDAQALLESFYRRFGCELIQQSDGYFYLLPSGDRLGRRQLSAGEMLVGQTLALLYLDPSTLEHGGLVRRETLLERLAGLIGQDVLVRTLNPRRRRYDERIAAETVRTQVAEALRRLSDLGFVDAVDEAGLRLRPALMRFAEPVRGVGDRAAALERLVASGEVLLGDVGDQETNGERESGDDANPAPSPDADEEPRR